MMGLSIRQIASWSSSPRAGRDDGWAANKATTAPNLYSIKVISPSFYLYGAVEMTPSAMFAFICNIPTYSVA
jgi:hypothetical protein